MSQAPCFQAYAELYDEFYRSKDYAGETSFVLKHLGEKTPPHSVLELGIGTARHAEYFIAKGLQVHGLDRSPEMISMAKKRLTKPIADGRCAVQVGDITTARLGIQTDSVVCLFHVMNYLPTLEAFHQGLRTARAHLKPGGRFLFDAWNGPGVLKDPPRVSSKEAQFGNQHVIRKSTPRVDTAAKTVEVLFEFEITAPGAPTHRFEEVHPMRLIFPDEVRDAASATGFKLVRSGAWLSEANATDEHWFVYYVLEAM